MAEDVRGAGMRRFGQKSVIITGGASGIGEATAARFLSEGARVLVMDVSAENITAVQGRLDLIAREGGGALHTVVGDVSDPNDVEVMVDQAQRLCGRLDVLINNAGIDYLDPLGISFLRLASVAPEAQK